MGPADRTELAVMSPVVTAPLDEMPAALTTPEYMPLAADTAPATVRPDEPTTPPTADTVPDAVRCAAVTGPFTDRPELPTYAWAALRMPDAVTPGTLTGPLLLRPDVPTSTVVLLSVPDTVMLAAPTVLEAVNPVTVTDCELLIPAALMAPLDEMPVAVI
jgi:hypothetical protein